MPMIVCIPSTAADQLRTPIDTDRWISGQPAQAVANAYSTADERFHCGIWEGDVGAWRVRYTEHELCHMLAGTVRMIGVAIAVDVIRDEEAGVFVGTSSDVPGLVVEAATLEELLSEAQALIPVLLSDGHDHMPRRSYARMRYNQSLGNAHA